MGLMWDWHLALQAKPLPVADIAYEQTAVPAAPFPVEHLNLQSAARAGT